MLAGEEEYLNIFKNMYFLGAKTPVYETTYKLFTKNISHVLSEDKFVNVMRKH